MSRIVIVLVGLFFILFSLLIVWVASLSGRLALANLGIGVSEFDPWLVGLCYSVLFAAGFVLVSGSLLESFSGAVVNMLAGGSASVGDVDVAGGVREGWGLPSKLLWGLGAYALVAFLFGTLLVLFVIAGEVTFAPFLDPKFLLFVLTWPDKVVAAVGTFGLDAAAFP